jgi:hypothetical protein
MPSREIARMGGVAIYIAPQPPTGIRRWVNFWVIGFRTVPDDFGVEGRRKIKFMIGWSLRDWKHSKTEGWKWVLRTDPVLAKWVVNCIEMEMRSYGEKADGETSES